MQIVRQGTDQSWRHLEDPKSQSFSVMKVNPGSHLLIQYPSHNLYPSGLKWLDHLSYERWPWPAQSGTLARRLSQSRTNHILLDSHKIRTDHFLCYCTTFNNIRIKHWWIQATYAVFRYQHQENKWLYKGWSQPPSTQHPWLEPIVTWWKWPWIYEEFQCIISDESIPDADDDKAANDTEMFDPYLNMEIDLPRGDDFNLHHARVKRRAVDEDGKPVGRSSNNPILDTRQYEVEFLDGSTETLSANTIAEISLLRLTTKAIDRCYS